MIILPARDSALPLTTSQVCPSGEGTTGGTLNHALPRTKSIWKPDLHSGAREDGDSPAN